MPLPPTSGAGTDERRACTGRIRNTCERRSRQSGRAFDRTTVSRVSQSQGVRSENANSVHGVARARAHADALKYRGERQAFLSAAPSWRGISIDETAERAQG